VVAYVRFQASELPRSVGVDAPGGRRRSDGRAGHLCHGPYLTLTPGRYAAGFYLRREPGEDDGAIEIEAAAEHGKRVLARRTLLVRELFSSLPGLMHVDFTVDAVERGCEMRLFVPARSAIEVSEAVLFRTDIAARGAA
jgi:hypothetical protein